MTKLPTLDDFPARTFDKLRYGDTDRQGHVNNAVFATFFETGRVEMLLTGGADFLAAGQSLLLARLEIDLVAEINWPGTVEIGTRVARIGRSSMTLEQAVFQNGVLAAKGHSVVVLTDETTRRSTPLGAEALARLEAFRAGTGDSGG
jgi:acyl-CoA thioester hydrolase